MSSVNTHPRRPGLATGARFLLLLTLWSAVAVAALGADGDFRSSYLLGRSSLRPSVESAVTMDAEGTLFVGVSFNTLVPTGRVVALTAGADGRLAEAWHFDTSETIEGSPVLAPDGTLYVGAGDGMLYALNKANGAQKWTYDAQALYPNPVYLTTPALSQDGGTLYVGLGVWPSDLNYSDDAGAVVAISTTGQHRWTKWLGGSVDSAPAVAQDGTLYVGALDGYLYALRPDGTEKWRRSMDAPLWGAPAIGPDGTIYVGSAVTFAALTPENQVKWQVPIGTQGGAAVGADGSVYVGNILAKDLIALTPSGTIKWRAEGGPGIGTEVGATPSVRADNTVLYGAGAVLRAYDGETGAIKWTTGSRMGGELHASPVIAPTPDHSIYIGSTDGYLYGFAGNTYPLSQYASWPMFQRDLQHTGRGPEIVSGGRLLNLGTRGTTGGGSKMIAGFVVQGSGAKQLLVRAVGPTLDIFPVPGALRDPSLTIYVTNAFTPYLNDDWGQSEDAAKIAATAAQVGAFPLPVGSKDSAVLAGAIGSANLAYTAHVDSADGQPGVALVEVYDANPDNTAIRLANLSTRGQVGTGDRVLIPGLVIGGPGKLRVLVRAVGPGLTQFGVPGVLQKPSMSVYNGSAQVIGSNTGWATTDMKGDLAVAAKLVGGFPLADNSTDSAMILTLAPGSYTIHVSGVGGTTGEALVEVYALPF